MNIHAVYLKPFCFWDYADVLVRVLLVTVLELEHCHNYSVNNT